MRRRHVQSRPLFNTGKAVTVGYKFLAAFIRAEEICPAAIVLVHLGIANIELLSANGVYDANHLEFPSMKDHSGDVETGVRMDHLAGDRGSVITGEQNRNTSNLTGVYRSSQWRLGGSFRKEFIEMLYA